MGISDYFGIAPGGFLYSAKAREAVIKGELAGSPYFISVHVPDSYVTGAGFAPVNLLESFGRIPAMGERAVAANLDTINSAVNEFNLGPEPNDW